jgi:cellulose synthase/poly-beta-1,6-N-acetylglucosamine synthase-like glycosyltransferase
MSAAIFWTALGLVAYTYAGYALLVALLARRRAWRPRTTDFTPALTVVIAAYNEAARIGARVRNVLAQDYPAERLRVVVVSDGSDDGTERCVPADDPRVRVLALAENRGKAAALNAAMAVVESGFVVFTDVRQRFAADALRRLMAPFADAEVGVVSGELELAADTGATQGGLYWRMEKSLREREALVGWLHGVSGAVYALRTHLFEPLPPGTILDDVWIPLHAAFAGQRIWMARDALAYDSGSATAAEEYRRKLRTLAGNWQLLARLPRLLVPWRNPLFLAWFSHKLLRLVAPWALLAAWLAAALAPGPVYQLAFWAQTLGYALAVLALAAPRLAARIPLAPAAGSFVMLNTAALLALPASLALDPRGLWKKH